MSVVRGFVIILVSGVCCGVVGGLLGSTLGVGAPAYYRGVFLRGNDPGFSPVEVGLGLGLTQGLICGLLIGSVIVLAVALSRRPRPESDPVSLPSDPQGSAPARSAGVRRAIAVIFVLAAIACSGILGFLAGAVVGQVELYRHSSEDRLARVRPILQQPPFANVRAEPTSDGKLDLTGTVQSDQDRKALEDRIRFLFGDEEARTMTIGVNVARK
jgi:hypothetical protein